MAGYISATLSLHMTNAEILRRADQRPLSATLRDSRRLRFFGHVARLEPGPFTQSLRECQSTESVLQANTDGCKRLQPTGGLTAKIRVGGRLAMFYIHQMNRMNSRNDLVVMMTAI